VDVTLFSIKQKSQTFSKTFSFLDDWTGHFHGASKLDFARTIHSKPVHVLCQDDLIKPVTVVSNQA
jgi:hypothetical protein